MNVSGELYTSSFDDPDDGKDSASTDKKDKSSDFLIRILAGGRGCNHMKENGSR